MAMAQPAFATTPPTQPLPTDDIIVLRGATWTDYQRLLTIRGERSVPRITYLEGVLELMSPSRPHEVIKSMIGCLVEAWCIERNVDITPYGSWTHQSEQSERGVEPDECYVLGSDPEPERCDLAIEVVWTRGAVNKIDVYRKLGVRELWIWKSDALQVHSLSGENYVPVERSALLPELDLDELLTFIDVKPMTRAVREYREKLRAAGHGV
jgi:Uma2 family endonuclease